MDKGIQKLPRRKRITQDITVASQVVTQLLSSVHAANLHKANER